jgi:hypothetical protein
MSIESKNVNLHNLKNELCTKHSFCRECFINSKYKDEQNPPNVFRDVPDNSSVEFFFVFDKPNNNNKAEESGLVPITILDCRYENVQTRKNLIKIFGLLGIENDTGENDRLSSNRVYITNAVKCDKCPETGNTGRITLEEKQVMKCKEKFFFKELDILQPKTIILFGRNAEHYIIGKIGEMWKRRYENINGKRYQVIFVPHTALTPFNIQGKLGEAYKDNLGTLFK